MVQQINVDDLRQQLVRYLWMHNRDWIQMAEEGEPMIAVEGEGVRIMDAEGRSWIDVNGGYNSVNVGYGRQEIADAAYEQMRRISYFPSGTTTEPTAQLAQKLAEITPGTLSRVFPVSGGSEANETAIKIVRAYHRRRGDTRRYKIISRQGSYHGTTAGVLWLGGTPATQRDDFEPAYPGMVYAPQPLPVRSETGVETPSECAVRCAQAVEDLIKFEGPETVAAVIGEPVAMPLGAVVPGDEYWPMIREICDRYGVLLISDEVINGFGRTGRVAMFRDRALGRRPGHYDCRQRDHQLLPADGCRDSVRGGRGGIRRRGRLPAPRADFQWPPGVGRGVAQEHRDHRDRGAGPELRRCRRVLQGAA